MKKNLKTIVFSTILGGMLFSFNSYKVCAADYVSDFKGKELHSYTIPNLDEDGAILQKSREELQSVTKNSKIEIENIESNFPNISIKGNVIYEDGTKPFSINGTLYNAGDADENRILISGKDTCGNFDLLDCSFYNNSEWIIPFDSSITDPETSSINTFYLLDKENRNITFCETIPTENLLEKEVSLIVNQDNLSTANDKDINWLGQVLKVINSYVEEPSIMTRAQGSQKYSYVKSFVYLNAPHKDTLDMEIIVTFDDRLSLGGSNSGWARIQCHGGSFVNLNTGSRRNSFSCIGKSGDTKMDLSLEGENTHGFDYISTTGTGDKSGSLNCSISSGFAIPKTGISVNFDWNPTVYGASYNMNADSFYNSVSANKYTRNITATFGKAFQLRYSKHFLASNFIIRDFNGSRKQNGKVTGWFTLPIYNSFDGSSDSIRLGRTVKYMQ